MRNGNAFSIFIGPASDDVRWYPTPEAAVLAAQGFLMEGHNVTYGEALKVRLSQLAVAAERARAARERAGVPHE